MLRGFFSRERFHHALGCGPFSVDPGRDIIVDPGRDPGVFLRAHELLRLYEGEYAHAVVMLDAAWEGSPGADAIREALTTRLKSRWDSFTVVVIDPELEAWIWQDSPHVAQTLNFPSDFRAILERSGH